MHKNSASFSSCFFIAITFLMVNGFGGSQYSSTIYAKRKQPDYLVALFLLRLSVPMLMTM